jgi:hypothetical protein
MYNLRYHLASLVAVFLALTIGLMLGSVVAEKGYLDAQQAVLVQGLQEDFGQLREANDRLQSDYERDHGFTVWVAEAFSVGLLEGRTVLVIDDRQDSDALAAASDAIVQAGGRVVRAVFSEPVLGLDDAALRDVVRSFKPLAGSGFDRDLATELVTGLASELATLAPQTTPYLDALVEADVLELWGWDPGHGIDGVVLMGSFDGNAEPTLVRLVSRLHELGVTAVAAETSDGDGVVVTACLEAGLSAVDAIDLPQGSLSLALVLSGRAEGHFGIRDGADSLYPRFTDVGS